MTTHTMRGQIGMMFQIYKWSANVITSCDFGVWIAVSNGAYQIALDLLDKKQQSAKGMYSTYYGALVAGVAEDITANGWLYDAWMHYIDFEIGITLDMMTVIPANTQKITDCVWDEVQQSPYPPIDPQTGQ